MIFSYLKELKLLLSGNLNENKSLLAEYEEAKCYIVRLQKEISNLKTKVS